MNNETETTVTTITIGQIFKALASQTLTDARETSKAVVLVSVVGVQVGTIKSLDFTSQRCVALRDWCDSKTAKMVEHVIERYVPRNRQLQ